MTVRVLLVDDQQLVRAGLRMLCDTDATLEVVGRPVTETRRSGSPTG
ncbi:hypothetical protein F5544_07910 [Nocardia arthritidis]|uniref:Response regulator n=1 Tax=Nocardia arthritidis TaxID=228602 RepID=A0A6G9Y8L2_9NOCA|nr:hypothetical protein F5544_07910 [Nocardia arthritidis]